MKKKSLLILPVLLLALAACNNDEEDVVEENPGITDTTDGNQGNGDGGDGGEKEQIDTRIILATESIDFGVNAGFVNPETLSIADTTVDEDGNVTYVLSGTPSTMSGDQANVFWEGVAAEHDAYIAITIEVKEDEKVSWLASDGQEKSYTYAECEGEVNVVIRISGICLSNEIPMGRAVYTISNETAGTSVTHTVDFSSIIELPSRVTLTSGPVYFDNSNVPFENSDSLYIASAAVGEDGNLTYYLAGTPNVMDENQEEAFQVTGAAGSAYVVLTVTLEENETVTWGFEIEETNKTRSYDQYPNGMDVVLKVTSEGASSVKFTIANSTAETSVDHIVDLSAYVTTSEGVE